jgi:4-amino-4-deoxy-L-arabinose transferase-like glycosyltransferase
LSRKKKVARRDPAHAEPATRRFSWSAWIEAHAWLAFAVLVAIASARIVATYYVFSHTVDEPAHIACGLEWIEKGSYRLETQHPPLARVAAAMGPYLAGRRITENALGPDGQMHVPDIFQQGALILYLDSHYDRNLALARLGVLPFFWIGALVVFLWGRKAGGAIGAVLAVGLFSFLPPVLAHAGLATTDMALTAFAGASFVAALWWMERPGARRAALFGATTGLAVLSKFSALAYLPVAFLAALVWYLAAERPRLPELLGEARRRVLTFLLAVAVGALVIWAGYRFSVGPVPGMHWRLPAPEVFDGVQEVVKHNRAGHSSFLLGERRTFGWWYYFPVVLGVKTPLAFLALLVFGGIALVRDGRNRWLWAAAAFSGSIVFYSLFSSIDIGVRHILPVYIGLSILAAAGARALLRQARAAAWGRWACAILLVWSAATSLAAHPDYIPYFNALAGDQPEKILADSNLDWGQDVKRLGERLRELNARQVSFTPITVSYLEAGHGFPPVRRLDPLNPAPGWNAVSLCSLKIGRLGLGRHFGLVPWPERLEPNERVGKTIWLYYFPPQRPGRNSVY